MSKLKGIGLFATGAGIGIAVGLLYAPRAGKHTRARIRDTANRTVHRAEEIRDDIRVCVLDLVDDATRAIASGKAGAQNAGECLLKTFDNIRENVDNGRERIQECIRSVAS